MNLVKEYLGSIAGVHVFAIIAMLIFLVTFLFMIYHSYSLRKDEVRNYSRLPLDEEDEDKI
jgi:hypothetical protein